MKKNHIYLFFAFILFVFAIPQTAFSTEKVKTVVVFFSLDVNLPAYHGFLDGLNQQFSETNNKQYNLIVEYIDVNRFPDESFIKNSISLYDEKYKAVDIDLLITFGPGAFPILKKYNFQAITHVPTINIDIESNIPVNNADPFSSNEKVLHINIKTNYKETLKTAFELFPDNKDVYIISGSAPADHFFAGLTQKAAESFKESHNFVFYNGITLDSTLAMVRTIPQSSIVFVTSYLEDINKIPYSTLMVDRIISTQCKAPFFTLSDEFFEGGAIGGYVYSFIALGKKTGKITEEVIGGKPFGEITVDENSFNKHMYDWEQLKKWNLLESNVIPSDSEFFNKEENFVQEYRWYLIGILLFLIGQTMLIMFLMKLIRRQKSVSKQRIENEQLFRELAREDRLSRMSELTASLSHELNQPLTAILYNAQAGKRFVASGKLDDEQAAEIFNNIIEDDKRAGSLISSVRSLMKLESREKEKVNLNSIILETEKIFHSESIAQHIKIKLKLQEQPVFVFGDKIQLQQVLLNLLFNAANSMEKNDAKNKNIEVVQFSENDDVTVSIRDSGSGFDNSLKDQLFKPFVTTTTKGLGIGLAVSRSIIEQHQGEIWAENVQGGGAEFFFKLKIHNEAW